jgi:hypothetical protein
MKPEKPHGPPPFEYPQVNRFETSQGSLSGLQISLLLSNICAYQDRLFAVIFGSHMQEQNALAQAVQSVQSNSSAATTKRPSPLPGNSSGRWTELGRTEVRLQLLFVITMNMYLMFCS